MLNHLLDSNFKNNFYILLQEWYDPHISNSSTEQEILPALILLKLLTDIDQ